MAQSQGISRELAPQRLDRLRDMLRDRQVVRLDDASNVLHVSQATVRRDLEQLERLGEARRVHGGAVLVRRQWTEPGFDDKASWAQREKFRIAEKAAALIQPKETIFLDGGSTILGVARLIRERGDITVATNSLRAAWELADGGPKLIVIGGELRRISQSVVGPLTRFLLEEIRFDRAFMGTLGLTLDEGVTTTDANEAYTKELVMRQSKEVVLLADSSKIGNVTFARSGQLDDVDILVTDKAADKAVLRGLRKKGAKVILA
jgi:DeoR/GlpR family transcriptional regulator of sugar metabolism